MAAKESEDYEDDMEGESADHSISEHSGDKRKRIFSKECE